MATGTSEQQVSSGGQSTSSGVRDLNTSIGGLDLQALNPSNFLNNFGAATSSATSGAVTVGDRILGGTKSRRQFGLVKMLALIAGAAILYKIYKKKG